MSVFPSWPGSNTQQAHGSSGVDAAVKNTNGAVGYVDVYYGVTANLQFMKIRNKAGYFINPTTATIAAASKIDTTPKDNGELSIVNPPNTAAYQKAYPISTVSFVLVPKKVGDPTKATLVKSFVKYALTTGQKAAPNLFYAELPSSITSPAVTAVASASA